MRISRRQMMKLLAGAGTAAAWPAGLASLLGSTSCAQMPFGRASIPHTSEGTAQLEGFPRHSIASGPFKPTWESLIANYQAPEWFRDAKLGLWAHWSAQCVPEDGDWYARQMYIQGNGQYDYHVKNYGHPTRFGFMEIDNLWKAEKWDPEAMMDLYVRAGAKYFVSLANHHDNFDNYASTHHAWNSTRVGPMKDIVGTWAKVARARGLRFGVSNHSAHAWHWFQTAYGYDPEGPHAGERYDAYTLTKEDGKGKWWEGLDPQELYTGRNMVMPDGIKTAAEAARWHEQHDRQWTEDPPAMNPKFTETWFLRCKELIDKYDPDLIYFDNFNLPLGQTGLDIAAHYYNQNLARRGGLEAVINAKQTPRERLGALVDDHERGLNPDINPNPWQTDTCIGQWHYQRNIRYKSVSEVVGMLLDIVSKNGNLLLSIPVRGNGTFDEREIAFLHGLGDWMSVNGEGIHGTRPWKIYGEGPTRVAAGMFSEGRNNFGAKDIRFMQKGNDLFMFTMGIPTEAIAVRALGLSAGHAGKIGNIEMIGSGEPLRWEQTGDLLKIEKPSKFPTEHAAGFRIRWA